MNKRKLLGRIKEFGSQQEFAKAIKMAKSSLNLKINGHREFSREEIVTIAKVLNLSNEDILAIFFSK